MKTPVQEYIKKIEEDYKRGNATEYTYRGSLELLMEALGGRGVDASNDPKHISCGAPDFIVERRKVPLGYVETKDVGVDLDKIEKTEQMKRYLMALNNLILTDYLEFRWYTNGEFRRKVRLAEINNKGKLLSNAQDQTELEQLFSDFFATETPTVSTAKELAERLAGVTHFIRDQIIAVLESGDAELKQSLEQQYKAFVDLLLPTIKSAEFADLYAQAITYGLFAAKLSAPENAPFNFEDAYKYLRGNPFLRRLFMNVNEQLDELVIIQPYLKDIVSLLNRANFHSILADFGRRTRTEDPVVHFYETFLATYDPKLRQSRGVYYTPEPVVKFIVRAVDDLLKTRFGKSWGLADESVKVLDPATGTGTFLYYVIQQIHEEVVETRHQAGQWPMVSKQLLERIFGFELLIAPYVVCHLKLGLLLKDLDAPLEGKNERLHIYMTNALEEGVARADQLAGLGLNIAQESSDAAVVKRADDIMVVLGNPPYSGHSANSSKNADGSLNFIGRLLNEYYFVDGAPLGERNPKWLQDDYVKFIRYGEWRINKTGYGILAMITNHGYLDNPTFRGMRQHLINTFDEIYVMDLHGNAKKKELAPDGSKDENVFDIQQGVAIILAIKKPCSKDLPVIVRHTDLWGLRQEKYSILQERSLKNLLWAELQPNAPYYLFIEQNIGLQNEYNNFWKISDLFPINNVGIVTGQDAKTIGFTKEKTETLSINLNIPRKNVTKIFYRPFDQRYIVYDKKAVTRTRYEIMRHMLDANNLGLIIPRRVETIGAWQHILCSDTLIEHVCVSLKTIDSILPLYIYTTPQETAGTLFAQTETTRQPNISPEFIKEFSAKLGLQFIPDGEGDLQTTFGPEDVFYYAYAIFHSPTYRERYIEFLKIDFPRLPLTSDPVLFAKLVQLGKQLVDLHLLRNPKLDEFLTSYPVTGDNKVEKLQYANGNVYINTQQYFGGVPEEVWNFKIGGYQVCEKWLKDRKGRSLSGEDISHYQRVVVALHHTIRLMVEIDDTISEWPIT